jgi:hypothetical protein
MVAVLSVDAGVFPGLYGQERGKSELRGAVCRITSGRAALRPLDGKCHRENTALASARVRVKRCGKSAPPGQ